MMIVLLHVAIALTSIVYATYTCFRPSTRKIHAGYGLVAATVASGTYLVISTHSPLLPSCATGLIYLGIVMSGLVVASRRADGKI